MTQEELSRFYWVLATQANCMGGAIEFFEKGDEQRMWLMLLLWADVKQEAKELLDPHDTMALATAMGISDGIKKAWE